MEDGRRGVRGGEREVEGREVERKMKDLNEDGTAPSGARITQEVRGGNPCRTYRKKESQAVQHRLVCDFSFMRAAAKCRLAYLFYLLKPARENSPLVDHSSERALELSVRRTA